jgi:hypothetical protein
MKTTRLISGLKNSQRIRWIISTTDGSMIGMYATIKQIDEQFATATARQAVYDALTKLSQLRAEATKINVALPTGLVHEANGFQQVQVDLI